MNRSTPRNPPKTNLARELLLSALIFACAGALGFILLVALFKAKVLASLTILFYRGLVLCAVAFILTGLITAYVVERTHVGTVRDAFAAACLSLGLNLAFLVIVPVTIDRSVSVFMLAYMDQHAGEKLTSPAIEQAFDRIYVQQLHAIDRRLSEQIQSGNVEAVEGGYRISPRGRAFIATSHMIAWLFDTDTRLLLTGVKPEPKAAAASSAGTQP